MDIKDVAEKYGIDYSNKLVVVLAGIIVEQEKRIESIEKKKTKKAPGAKGKKVWEAYTSVYTALYKSAPVRNAMTNRICCQLVDRLGEEDAIGVVIFYLECRDAFLVRNTHHIKFCLSQAETFHTKWKSGIKITHQSAKRAETSSHNIDQTREYLRRKHAKQ